jgi:hypothetical protein
MQLGVNPRREICQDHICKGPHHATWTSPNFYVQSATTHLLKYVFARSTHCLHPHIGQWMVTTTSALR